MIQSRAANILVIVLGVAIATPALALTTEYRDSGAVAICSVFLAFAGWCIAGGITNLRRPMRPDIPALWTYRLAAVLAVLLLTCAIGAYASVFAAAWWAVSSFEGIAAVLARATVVLLCAAGWLVLHHSFLRSRIAR